MRSTQNLIMYTDGACTSNPGDMGVGVYILNTDGDLMHLISKQVGLGTNNEAEYHAIIEALKYAKEVEADEVEVRADSQIVVNQLKGSYDTKTENLQVLNAEAKKLLESMNTNVQFNWINRAENSYADALACHAINVPNACVDIENKQITFWKEDLSFFPELDLLETIPITKDITTNAIIEINMKNNVGFKECIKLKTAGLDNYSKLKLDELKKIVQIRFGERTIAFLEETMRNADNEYVISVYRWIARGLKPDAAFKKVSVDRELYNKK